MSQNNLSSEFPEKISGVEFENVNTLQAIQMMLKSVMVAKARGAFRYEEEITMYPSILTLRRVLREALEQQQKNQTQSEETPVPEKESQAQETDKKITLAPTVTPQKKSGPRTI